MDKKDSMLVHIPSDRTSGPVSVSVVPDPEVPEKAIHRRFTAENHERVLKSFYDKSNGLWTGCVWYRVYEAMLHADVRIVTLPENHALAREIGFTVYDGIEEAYRDALNLHGADARVAFVPYGRYTILQG